MNAGTRTYDVLNRPDATPEQWATLAAAVANQPDADYLADVLDLHRAMHDQSAGIDRRRTTIHTRKTVKGARA